MPFGEGTNREPEDFSVGAKEFDSRAEGEQQRTELKITTLKSAEHHLASALGLAEHRNQADTLNGEGFDALAQRLSDLSDALSCLEGIRNRRSKDYQASIERILDGAEFIKALIGRYGQHENPRGGRLGTNEVLLDLLLKLRRIDAARFPRDMIQFTDNDLKALSFPAERWIWSELLARARIAEFDPERFRGIFGTEYSRNEIARHHALWTKFSPERQDGSGLPDCRRAWEVIETALRPVASKD